MKKFKDTTKEELERLVMELNGVISVYAPYDAKVIMVIGDFVNAQVFHNFTDPAATKEMLLEMLRRTANNYEFVQLQPKPSTN